MSSSYKEISEDSARALLALCVERPAQSISAHEQAQECLRIVRHAAMRHGLVGAMCGAEVQLLAAAMLAEAL